MEQHRKTWNVPQYGCLYWGTFSYHLFRDISGCTTIPFVGFLQHLMGDAVHMKRL